MEIISETDLILNADGSAYHLNLLPEDVADTVITVGDPDRVGEVSKYFDSIELKKGKREFITHTGYVGKKRITVLSTGIGTDNIDIVLNELDALVNVDFNTRTPNARLKQLNIIRIGTSGAIQADIPVDSLLVSSAAFGLDALMGFYKTENNAAEQEMLNEFTSVFPSHFAMKPYLAPASPMLLDKLAKDIARGITITSPGFYSPQGRQVRALTAVPGLMDMIAGFAYKEKRITNLEMETAGIYGLAKSLGHHAISFNVILANRATKKFSKQPGKIVDNYIAGIIEKINNNL
ncbi:nucleoside phosphorylase [Mucilaginibacter segetis]|uniref:Uridine phosphorylase n=1 Tax=Mucilaginibacter segetis TaxID=2793071 RepID=A0A934UPC0_9SPHI|nr:nucleoside phosphorylase [Mucilaginibacter segetis]MBK0380751.1 nucleoside phosphorylase [Mucilaginibacter segetis]